MIDSRLPSLIIIGGMKCGTTSLYQYLSGLDGITSSSIKEPSFFDDIQWTKGLDWYKSLFKDDNSLKFEASTIYSKYPLHKGIAERIHQTIPEVKLIYIVRSPVERILSQLKHNVKTGNIRPADLDSPSFRENDLRHYLNCSKYYLQIAQYLEFFDREQIFICTTSQLREDPVGLLQRILDFWRTGDIYIPESIASRKYNTDEARGRLTNKRLHRVMYGLHKKGIIPNGHKFFETDWEVPARYLSEEFRAECLEELADDIAEFKNLTGIDFSQ